MEKNSSTFPLMLMGVLARAHIDISEDFGRMCHEGGGHGNRKIIFSIFSPFQAILCTFHYLRKKLLKMPHSGPWGGVVVVPELFLWLDGVPRYVVCTC